MSGCKYKLNFTLKHVICNSNKTYFFEMHIFIIFNLTILILEIELPIFFSLIPFELNTAFHKLTK